MRSQSKRVSLGVVSLFFDKNSKYFEERGSFQEFLFSAAPCSVGSDPEFPNGRHSGAWTLLQHCPQVGSWKRDSAFSPASVVVFGWCDSEGKDAQSCSSISQASPSLWAGRMGLGEAKEFLGGNGSREQLPAVTPSARGTRLGEGWGRGRERTRGATGQRKPSGWHLTLTRGSHPCWSAVMLLKCQKRTSHPCLPWLLPSGLAEL